MKRARATIFPVAVIAGLLLYSIPARAGNLTIPPEAQRAMDLIYTGDPDAAIAIARTLQQSQPDHPLGFALEGEALWWKRFCAALEIKYGLVDSWKHGKDPGDESYLKLTDKVIQLAQAQLAKSETAEMRVYAGMGYALKARVYAVRGENRNVARAGVAGRSEMLRALELDPQMADATAGLGIYNYYVATLPGIVKLIRFFMGIPGGDKEVGVKQMEEGMTHGVLLAVDVRFILARALRQFDQKYEQALSIAEPLADRYPRNPNFLLLLGNLYAELGRNPKASEYFHAVLDSPASNSACANCVSCAACNACIAHARDLAKSFLATIN